MKKERAEMKWQNVKRVMVCLWVGSLLTGTVCGCSGTENNKDNMEMMEKGSIVDSQNEEETPMYPIEENVKLTMAIVEDSIVTTTTANIMETPFGQAWQEATGVEIEEIRVADVESMNLLFTSDELPDLLWYDVNNYYPGGAVKAIKDKIIEPLNDYMEYAPDLQAVLESNDLYQKSCMTESGDIIGFPFIRGDKYLLTSAGMMIRQDWLDDLEMKVPETPDELYTVLKAFKEEKGATVPFSVDGWYLENVGCKMGLFTSAFGLPNTSFYQKDGVVHYGAAEKEYKEVLRYLNQLYSEGLLEQSFQTLNTNMQTANILNGNSGVTIASVGSGMGSYLQTMADDTTYDLTGFGPLVKNNGDIPMYTSYSNPFSGISVCVTSGCKNMEAAIKFLNYGYTEEGSLLFNFGVEGESYTLEEGTPTYTDIIMNNSEGLTKQQALARYTCSWATGPFVQDKRYILQYANMPQQVAAIAKWSDSDADKYALPSLTIAEEKVSEYSELMEDIDIYVSEMFIQYVTGLKSLDTFESEYLKRLEAMGVDRVITMKQVALDAFNAR